MRMKAIGLVAVGVTWGCVEAQPLSSAMEPPVYWQMDDRSTDDGWLVGYTLSLGVLGETPSARIDLHAESFAAGPWGDDVVYGDDDGRTSAVMRIDARTGASRTLLKSDQVLRRATMDPAGDALWVFALERATRRELGVWRVSLAGDAVWLEDQGPPAIEPLPPAPPDDETFGPVFTTEFHWSLDGAGLAIQSCSEILCRTRVVDPRTTDVKMFDALGQGELLALANGALVFYEAGNALPAPVHVVDIASRAERVLTGEAGLAAVVDDERGPVLLFEASDGVWKQPLDGSRAELLPTKMLTDASIVGTGPRALAHTALPKGFALLGLDGRLNAPHGDAAVELVRVEDAALFTVGKE